MRGAVISPYMAKANSFSLLGDIPIIGAFRNAILYWDRVSIPIPIKGLAPMLDSTAQALVELGAAEITYFRESNYFRLPHDLPFFVNQFINKLAALRNQSDEIWSILCPAGDTQDLAAYMERMSGTEPEKKTANFRQVEIAIKNSLPVPFSDVPYQDILEFKNGRRNELERLHHEVEKLSASLVSISFEEAFRIASKDIDLALADLNRVFSEKWTSRIFGNLRASLGSIITGIGGGVIVAEKCHLPLTSGVIIGGAASPVISATINSFTAKRKLPERAAPYIYAYEAGQL